MAENDIFIPLEVTRAISTMQLSHVSIFDEDHQFFEGTEDDVDVRVEFSSPIHTDVHTHNSDTSDAKRE